MEKVPHKLQLRARMEDLKFQDSDKFDQFIKMEII